MTRLSAVKRVSGASFLGALLGASCWGAWHAFSTRPQQPPFQLSLTVQRRLAAIGQEIDPRSRSPQVLMFVRESCDHCRAELRHWEEIGNACPDVFREVDVVVITATPIKGARRWIGGGLSHRRLHDADGALATSLGVRLVPLTIFVDDQGTVLHVAAGETRHVGIVERLRSVIPERRRPKCLVVS